jgi:hypothetical protein
MRSLGHHRDDAIHPYGQPGFLERRGLTISSDALGKPEPRMPDQTGCVASLNSGSLTISRLGGSWNVGGGDRLRS